MVKRLLAIPTLRNSMQSLLPLVDCRLATRQLAGLNPQLHHALLARLALQRFPNPTAQSSALERLEKQNSV
jgi:hypothetical protein